MEAWQAVLVALAGGIALLVTALFTGLKRVLDEWVAKFSKRVRKRTYIQQIEKLADFLEQFEKIKKIVEVQRCIIFHGHNCGGLPTPGKPYTVRAVHGWTTKEGKDDPGDKYDFDLHVDGHYIRMLEDIVKTGAVTQALESMPADSKLRSYYVEEGVRYSKLYYLGMIDDELIFLAAATYDLEVFSEKTVVGLQVMVDRLRSSMGEVP